MGGGAWAAGAPGPEGPLAGLHEGSRTPIIC